MTDLYIYYRVRDDHAGALAPRVRAMQGQLTECHAVAGQLKRRPDSVSGVQTWMEVYPCAPAGFETVLMQAVIAAALPELTDGERHTEVFTDL